jgi:methylmalonyl-CoA epimerase
MKVKKINHIGIVVRDIQEALTVYEEALGLTLTRIEERPEIGVNIAFLPTGDSEIELVQPTTEDSGVAAFLEKRRGGLHHICLEVDDIEAALAELQEKGLKLIDKEPRQGTHGERYAFLHPKSTHGVLLELYELSESSS